MDKLSPPVLGQLITHVGLEDAGELVAVASTQQLERVWDRDLWVRPEQGGAERFAPERFALWLAVMLEAGEALTVARLRELPFDLLTLGVHGLVRVVERDTWLSAAQEAPGEDESGLYAPWQELMLIARDEAAWDVVFATLLALDEEDHALLRRVLDRCRDIDAQLADLELEPDEIYSALTSEAALESDVAAERDERQSASGYLSAADAQSFLRGARALLDCDVSQLNRDPIADAYFRELAPVRAPEDPPEVAEAASALLGLLADSGVLEARAAGALPLLSPGAEPPVTTPASDDTGVRAEVFEPEAGAPSPPSATDTLLQAAILVLAREAPALWSERMEELGFLANAVLAAGRDRGRRFELRAALEAASALCNLGLELQLKRSQHANVPSAVAVLRRVPADRLFRAGSSRAFIELTLPARRALAGRCERHASAHAAELDEALTGDELGGWPDVVDAELLRMSVARFETLRALAEAIPRLHSGRFVTTVAELQRAKRAVPRAKP